MTLSRFAGCMLCGLFAAHGEPAGDYVAMPISASMDAGSTQVVRLKQVTERAFYHGRVDTSTVVDMTAPASGSLDLQGVAYGDKVTDGQELFTIRSDQLEQDIAEVERGRADAAWWLEFYYPSAARTLELRVADIRLRGARELERSAAMLVALQRGIDENIVSQDEHRAQVRKHEEAIASHEALLAEAELKLVDLERARREHHDRLRALELRLASLQEASGRARVHAPFEGRVVGLAGGVSLVDAGAYIMTLASESDAAATFLVSAAELSSFLEAPKLTCEIKRIAIVSDCDVISVERNQSPGEYAVRVRLSDPPSALISGDIVAVGKILGQREAAIVVPLTSLVTQGGVTGVYVAEAQGRAFRAVELGVRGVDDVEVVAGIAVGEVIFTGPDMP